MRLLLDTHVLIWWTANHPMLSDKAKTLIANPANEVYFSSISIWEIAIKHSKLQFPLGALEMKEQLILDGFLPLAFSDSHAAQVAKLAAFHADPFDRALIAQALYEPMHLVTHDQVVAQYDQSIIQI